MMGRKFSKILTELITLSNVRRMKNKSIKQYASYTICFSTSGKDIFSSLFEKNLHVVSKRLYAVNIHYLCYTTFIIRTIYHHSFTIIHLIMNTDTHKGQTGFIRIPKDERIRIEKMATFNRCASFAHTI